MHAAAETGQRGTLNDEQWAQVDKCLKFVAPLERGADAVHKELRLQILDGLTFGTADRVITRGRNAKIVDWKMGWVGVDDAEINKQGWAYALGVFDNFPVDEVEVIFVSPRRDEVSRHTFTRGGDYTRLATDIRLIIERCKLYELTHEESLLNPHDDACAYCGAIGTCPKHLKYGIQVAKKYAPLELVDEVHSSQIVAPEQMAKALKVARIMEKWVESVKKHSLEMVKSGIPLPGFSLRERAGTRGITNPVLAYRVLRDAGLDDIEIVSASKLSITGLEKLVSDKAPRGQKQKSVAALNAALANAECLSSEEPTLYLQKDRE